MSSKPPYFPFYPKDFAADDVVECMSTAAVGAYILLLCKAWHQDPPASLPDDDRVLARWARLEPDAWTDVRPDVVAAFTTGTDGRLHQKRLRQEYEKFRERSKKAQDSANKRWGKADELPPQCERNANAMQRAYGSGSKSASGSSSVESETKDTHNSRMTESQARAVYGIYPRKMKPRDAVKAIISAHKRLVDRGHDDPVTYLTARTMAFAKSPSGQPPPAGGTDYRSYPATWFNADSFDEEDHEWQKPNGASESNRPNANISRVAAKPGKYANVGETVDANFPANSEAD